MQQQRVRPHAMATSSRRPAGLGGPAGITLVEVVAAWFLVASLLVGVLLGYSRHQRQLRRAEQRLDAATAAEQLLAGWYAGAGAVPRFGRGVLPGTPGWMWRTAVVRRTLLESVSFDVVRLELFAADGRRAGPAAQVELLLPTPPPARIPSAERRS